MSVLVYQAITAITAELAHSGIAKTHRNEEGEYSYRSIEDVLSALAPLLARHRLCVLPRILSREAVRFGRAGQLVSVQAAFDLVSALDGSVHTVQSYGEALDDSDKGTAKAISSAYKSAMLQAFCIPVPQEDADASSPKLNGSRMNGVAVPEPVEGWDAWASEVIAITKSCDSAEAIDRLMTGRRPLLSALQRSRPELYATIGEAIANRLEALQRPEMEPRSATGAQAREQVGAASAKRAKAPPGRIKASSKSKGAELENQSNAARAAAEAA
jgi:hypothetical protein